MRIRLVLMLIALAGAPVTSPAQERAAPTDGHVATVRGLWESLTGFITTAAEELPEDKYSYQPTKEVRSFGQMIGHVAGAQQLICAAALGKEGGAEDDIERSRKTKAELVAALKESTQFCARAYGQTDQTAAQPAAKLFGQQRSRFHALTLNATHNAEHYGNIVTYLRLNGIVPPSSR
jgi:uncharacterized damage-inducible protein DinB